MLNQDYTAKLLNLEDVIITNVENISGQLHISLELPRAAHVCPACGGVTDVVHDYRMQTIKDVPLARDYLSAPAQASLSLFLRQAFLREKRFPRPLPEDHQQIDSGDHLFFPKTCFCNYIWATC